MAQFSTPQELQKAMIGDLFDVVSGLTDYYLDVLKQNVDDKVYQNPNYQPSVYERTGQFLDSWGFRILPTTRSNEFGMEIFSDPDQMVYDPESSQHGSPNGEEDRREVMVEAILWGAFWDYDYAPYENNDGDENRPFEWWKYPDTRDFWTPTIEEMDESFRKMAIKLYKENGKNIIIV